MSGRGGTTGRAAGCPARFGRAGARKGIDGAAGPGAGEPGAGWLRGAELRDAELRDAEAGTAGPGAVSETGGVAARAGGIGIEGGFDGRGAAGEAPLGIGCLGPVRIWPGRGVGGAGRAGTAPPVRSGGCRGALGPVAKGGRMGAGFERAGSSVVEAPAPLSE